MDEGVDAITFIMSNEGGTLHITRQTGGLYIWSVEYAHGALWVELSADQSRAFVNNLIDHFDLCDRT